MCTTLCSSSCEYCVEPHHWHRCHMYGLGIYLADMPAKSHRYVRAPMQVSSQHFSRKQDGKKAPAAEVVQPSAAAKYIGSGVEDLSGRHLGVIQASVGGKWLLQNNTQLSKSDENVRWRLGRAPLKEGTKVRVIANPSVAYRNSPQPQDRKTPSEVEDLSNIIIVTERCGDWVRGSKGWLPMRAPTASGTVELLQLVTDEAVASPQKAEDWNEDWWIFSLLRCRVCLGNPYLIEGNLMEPHGMHDHVWCQNPEDELETVAEEWDVAKGHDSYFVKGQEGHHAAGLGVHNNEYVVFHPFQVLPLYKVDYTIS